MDTIRSEVCLGPGHQNPASFLAGAVTVARLVLALMLTMALGACAHGGAIVYPSPGLDHGSGAGGAFPDDADRADAATYRAVQAEAPGGAIVVPDPTSLGMSDAPNGASCAGRGVGAVGGDYGQPGRLASGDTQRRGIAGPGRMRRRDVGAGRGYEADVNRTRARRRDAQPVLPGGMRRGHGHIANYERGGIAEDL